MQYSKWEQSLEYTCGAASLMVAMHELVNIEMSESREIQIWRAVHPICYVGSMPGYLAIFAQQTREIDAQIFYSPQRCKQMLSKLPLLYRFFYRMLLIVNNWSMLLAKIQRIKIYKMKTEDGDLAMMVNFIKGRGDTNVLLVVEVEGHELHYVLVRYDGKKIVVMDPAYGENITMCCGEFIQRYNQIYAGFHVLLTKTKRHIEIE